MVFGSTYSENNEYIVKVGTVIALVYSVIIFTDELQHTWELINAIKLLYIRIESKSINLMLDIMCVVCG